MAPSRGSTPARASHRSRLRSAADGSFSTTLEVTSTFTTPAGDIDCGTTACAVITFAAHGSPDRSQDTCVPLLVGAIAVSPSSPAPGASPDGRPLGRRSVRTHHGQWPCRLWRTRRVAGTLGRRVGGALSRRDAAGNEKTPPKRGPLHCPG